MLLFISCQSNQNESKTKELELKEKELLLRENELLNEKRQALERKEVELNLRDRSSNSTVTNRESISYGKYPEGSSRYLSRNEISILSSYQLSIIRNEIFARHGYIFKSTKMRNYFNDQNWYSPRFKKVDQYLSSIEKENIKLIKEYE